MSDVTSWHWSYVTSAAEFENMLQEMIKHCISCHLSNNHGNIFWISRNVSWGINIYLIIFADCLDHEDMDQDLDRDFLHDLRDIKALLEREVLEDHKVNVLRSLKMEKMSAVAAQDLEVNLKVRYLINKK